MKHTFRLLTLTSCSLLLMLSTAFADEVADLVAVIKRGSYKEYKPEEEVIRASAALEKLYSSKGPAQKKAILEALFAAHGPSYGHWEMQKQVADTIVSFNDPETIVPMLDRVRAVKRTYAHPSDADAYFRKAILELSKNNDRAKSRFLANVKMTFDKSSFKKSESETKDSPSPVSRVGSLMQEAFLDSDLGPKISSEDKAALLSSFLKVAQNLPQKEGNNVAGLPDSLTSRMDILQDLGKFGLSESQRTSLLLQMLVDSNSTSEVKAYCAKMAADLLGISSAEAQRLAPVFVKVTRDACRPSRAIELELSAAAIEENLTLERGRLEELTKKIQTLEGQKCKVKAELDGTHSK